MKNNKVFQIRLGQETIDKLEHLANRYQCSKAEAIRKLINQAYRRNKK